MIRNHSPERAVAHTQRLLPACLAIFMSAFLAAVVTAINTGVDAGYPLRWLLAWTLACPAGRCLPVLSFGVAARDGLVATMTAVLTLHSRQ